MDLPLDPNPQEVEGRTSPAKTWFYHIPPVWIISKPESDFPRGRTPVVLKEKLKCGIIVSIHQDGLFEFDFENYEPASSVFIPDFVAKPGFRLQIPKKQIDAEHKAFQHVRNRCALMNCFLACYNFAISHVEKTGTPVMQLTDPSNYLAGELNTRHNPTHCYYFLNRSEPRSIIIKEETLRYAIQEFDDLICKFGQECIDVLHIIYQAHHLYRSNDFENSLLLAWMASERLLNQIYERFIEQVQQEIIFQGKTRQLIDKKRKAKLNDGRTFSASVITEFLAFNKVIDTDLYLNLEEVRKARNNWVHRLAPSDASNNVSSAALVNTHKLFELVYQRTFRMTVSYNTSY